MDEELKVEVDTMLCIGAESCLQLAPRAFELNADGQAILVDASAASADQLRQAARNCPSGAIRVTG